MYQGIFGEIDPLMQVDFILIALLYGCWFFSNAHWKLAGIVNPFYSVLNLCCPPKVDKHVLEVVVNPGLGEVN